MKKFLSRVRTKLRGDESLTGVITVLIVVAVFLLNAVLYTLTSVFGLYINTSAAVDFRLSDAPGRAFSEAGADSTDVTVLFCQTEEEVEASATGSWVLQTARKMAEQYSFLHLEFADIISDPQRVSDYKKDKNGYEYTILKTSVIFIGPTDFRVVTDVSTDVGYRNFFSFNTSGQMLAYNGEEVMTSMILWALRTTHPKAYFTVYHGEIVSENFINLLTCAGYYVHTLDLRTEEIPEEADLVVISAPKSDFERSAAGSGIRAETDKLREFIDDGGNLYVSLDPYLKTPLTALSALLAEYGLALRTETDADGNRVSAVLRDTERGITTDGFTLVLQPAEGAGTSGISDRMTAAGAGDVILSSAGVLTLSEGARSLYEASSSAVIQADGTTIDRGGSYPVIAYGEKAGSGRVLLVPSVYLTADDALVSAGYGNRDFFYAVFDRLFGDGLMPYGCREILVSDSILENLTMGSARRLTALLFLIPAALAVTGAVVVIRRKNR